MKKNSCYHILHYFPLNLVQVKNKIPCKLITAQALSFRKEHVVIEMFGALNLSSLMCLKKMDLSYFPFIIYACM